MTILDGFRFGLGLLSAAFAAFALLIVGNLALLLAKWLNSQAMDALLRRREGAWQADPRFDRGYIYGKPHRLWRFRRTPFRDETGYQRSGYRKAGS
jgi:hypothetical protein